MRTIDRNSGGRQRHGSVTIPAIVAIVTASAAVTAGHPAAASSPLPGTSAEPATVRMVALGASIADWCFAAARDQSFFEDQAITLNDPLVVSTSPDLNRAMVAGEGDLALGSVDILHAAIEGRPPVRFIAATGAAAHTIAGPSGGPTGLESLRGKTVAMGPEATPSTLIAEAILDEQLGDGEYTPLPIGGGSSARVAALQSGQADAAILQPPFDQVAFENDSGLQFIDSFGAYGDFAQGVVIAQPEWLADHHDVAVRWLVAYRNGCSWVYDPANRTDAIRVLAEATDISETAAERTYENFIEGDFTDTALSRDAHLEPTELENYLQLVVDADILPEGTDVAAIAETVIEPTVWDEANELVPA